jgi:GNAT superfamily N-acetyltransferase
MNELKPILIIRKANLADAMVITQFQLDMAMETEGLQLLRELTSKGVEAVFADPSKGSYYIAAIGNKPVGSMLTTEEWSDWRNRTIVWIQSVYVVPGYRKTGVFRALYNHLLEYVTATPDIGGVRLLGMDGEHYKVFEWMK